MAPRQFAVVVGVGQVRRRPGLDGELDGIWEPQEPVHLLRDAIHAALADADVATSDVEALAVVDPIAWPYDDLIASTAAAADLPATVAGFTFPPGGNSPGDLLHVLANRMADGEFAVAVLAGCEAVYSIRRARKEGIDLKQQWTRATKPRDFQKGQAPLTTAVEARHGQMSPVHCYPLFENALRARAGRSIAEHQQVISALMSRNSAVAAANPYAWFPTAWTPEQIATVTPDNRWVCFPYPKRMNAIMEVDQSAALVIMTGDEADRRGIPRERQVVFLGGASAVDGWAPAERIDLAGSPAIRAAGEAAMAHAGVTMDDVDLIDLYSCFPSAVQMGMDALGLAIDDPRGVTVTGGLAYAGGPGNSYALHSMCVATQRLRSGDGEVALVSSLGMTATKHALSLLGVGKVVDGADHRAHKVELDRSVTNGPDIVDGVTGDGVVESYTVEYDRQGAAVRTFYVVRLDDGTRTVGVGPCTDDEVRALTSGPDEPIGQRVHVDGSGELNIVGFLTKSDQA